MIQLNEFLYKNHANAQTVKLYNVYKDNYKMWEDDEPKFWLIYDTLDDFDKLLNNKNFNYDINDTKNIIRDRANNTLKHSKHYKPALRIRYGSKNGTLTDAAIRIDQLSDNKTYELVCSINPNQFTLDYWKDKNWITW